MKGRLVVLEGIDGAGTTTQAKRLVDALRARGRDAHLTRESSGGPVGLLLREFLAGRHAPVDSTMMALLFAADRADHLQREIEPALARGAIVVTDRYYHSSLAYQGSEEERAWITLLNDRARRPDVTFLLQVPADVAARRREADGRAEEIYERAEIQKRVAEAYRQIAKRLACEERIEVLDGEDSVENLAAEILARTLELA